MRSHVVPAHINYRAKRLYLVSEVQAAFLIVVLFVCMALYNALAPVQDWEALPLQSRFFVRFALAMLPLQFAINLLRFDVGRWFRRKLRYLCTPRRTALRTVTMSFEKPE
jgi:hypothetical protein